MPGFFDQIVAFMTTEETVDALVADLEPVDRIAVRIGTVLATAAVVSELAQQAMSTGSGEWLRFVAMADAGPALSQPPAAGVTEYHQLGVAPAEALFGGRRKRVESLIAREARVGGMEAQRLLAATTWAAVAHLAEATGAGAGGASAPGAAEMASGGFDLQAEVDELSAKGWGRWIDIIPVITQRSPPRTDR